MDDSHVLRALRTHSHLACVSGPDRGAVLALDKATSVGRKGEFAIMDPFASRLHCRVRPAPSGSAIVGYIVDEVPTNPTRLGGRVLSRELPLRLGDELQIGKSKWKVRSRPFDLEWSLPPEANGARRHTIWLRVLPVLFLVVMLWRFTRMPLWVLLLAAICCAVIVLVIFLRRKRYKRSHYDPAFLALALQAQLTTEVSRQETGLPTSWIWTGHVGGKRLEIGPHRHLGFAGQGARSQARWAAAQFVLQNPQVAWLEEQNNIDEERPKVWVKGPTDKSALKDNTVIVAWAELPHLLPPEVTKIVPVRLHASPAWLPPRSEGEHASIGLPARISLAEVGCDLSPVSIKTRWQHFRAAQSTWSAPVGISKDQDELKVVTMGLTENGPHTLMAGGTGSGKSVALRTWLTSLCATIPPHALRIILVDYKGGAGLGPISHLPHIERFHTDLDASETTWMLRRLKLILVQRKEMLKQANHTDIADWEQSGDAPPRLLVVIDEFQALAEEHPQLLTALSRLAAQGRSLGIHLVLATQHPGPSVNASLRATLDQRIALRCNEAADSMAILGSADAAKLPRQPGVALLNSQTFQFAHSDPGDFPSTGVEQAKATPIWPIQLPSIGPDPTPALLGVIETEHGSPQHLYWDGNPLAAIGSVVVRNELEKFGISLATNTQTNLTFALGSDAPGFSATYTLEEPGDLALVLSRIRKYDSATMMVSEISVIMRELDALGVGPEASRAWTRLVREAFNKDLRLIVTDSEGHSSLTRIPQRLFRIPSGQAWSDAALLRLLPPLGEFRAESTDPHMLSREEATSAVPFRFVADGMSGTTRRVVLQAINSSRKEAGPCGGTHPCPKPLLPLARRKPLSEAELKEMTLIDTRDWMRTLQTVSDHFAVKEPPIEMLRYLAIRFPDDAIWLKAYHPFEEGAGILAANGQIDPCLFPNQ